MGLHKLFHDIVSELPIHEGRKADLHKQVDATVEKDDDGEINGTGSADGSSS